jgi:hypothetical protein
VWSQILPRLSWRYSNNCKAMNMAAVRLNNFAAWLCFKLGGSYIKYPEISWDATGMFVKYKYFWWFILKQQCNSWDQFSPWHAPFSLPSYPKIICVVGSSLVKNAFVEARQSYDGCSLGLKRNNFRVWWQGKGGMSWGELVPRIEHVLFLSLTRVTRRVATSRAGTVYPSGEHEFTSGVCCVCVYQSLVFL